jgi:hypothetical protein
MDIQTIKQALEYKQGHFNMVQYILKQNDEYSITVYDNELEQYTLHKSKDYKKIRDAIKENMTEILVFNDNGRQCQWAKFIPYNETDIDIVSDYSNTKLLDDWSKQFDELQKKLED